MNQNQQRILIFLSERVDARSSEITDGLCISLATFQRCFPELHDDDFVRKNKAGNAHVCRYSLTESGKLIASRLSKQKQYGQIPAPSMLINKFDGRYTPSHIYARNNGHTHIASRGFA